MEGLGLYDKVRGVPDNAKREIKGGRLNGKTDINPMWRIKTLTEQFGPCGVGWYYTPARRWTEAHGDEVAAFVDIELYVRVDGEWSKPIAGTGGSMFVAKERSGAYVSDECYKMATTDALSVACKQLGIGADVYWSADTTKYGRGEAAQGGAQLQGGAPQTQGQPATKRDIGNPGQQPSAQGPCINKAQVDRLYNECGRTGREWREVCAEQGVGTFSAMSYEQYSQAMKGLARLPDKPAEAGVDGPEGGLPWS